MTTHLTKIWWDLNKDNLVVQGIPEAEIYKREWVELTDEEIDAEWLELDGEASAMFKRVIRKFARAVLAKAKEKNNG